MQKLLNTIKKFIPKKLFKQLQPSYHFFMSWLAAFVYHHPSNKLIVIGITGTTGKTTSAYIMAKALQGAGYKVGLTSTAMFMDGKKEWLNDKKMTMVGRFFTQSMLHRMVKNKCQFAIIETTSEGAVQFRHRFINYDIVAITGLYPEHIESHGSFENYQLAKGKIFEHLSKCKAKYIDQNKNVHYGLSGFSKINYDKVKKTSIVNLDNEFAAYFLNFKADQKFAYTGQADLKTEEGINVVEYGNIVLSQDHTNFSVRAQVQGKLQKEKISLNLLGGFNATNAMNAVCAGLALEISLEQIKKGLETIIGVAGRLEKINAGQDFTVIVDYAFEPGAVAKLYEVLKLIPHQKIIHVLGSAGGGRDAARRPKLGELAGRNADIAIITNEDPYDEDPQLIIDQVAAGASNAGKKEGENLFRVLDRREAIRRAISWANIGDIVVITGKGNEQAICVADGEKVPWDDRIVTREELQKVL